MKFQESKQKREEQIDVDVKVRELIQLLDYEINLNEREHQRPGWTIWAIYGSLSAVSWLLLTEFESTGWNIGIVLILLIMIVFLIDLVNCIRFLLVGAPPVYSLSNRFSFSSELSTSRLTIFLNLLKYIAVSIFFFYSPISLISQNVIIAGRIYAILNSILLAFVLLLSFVKFPLPNTFKISAWNRIITSAVVCAIVFYIEYSLLPIVFPDPNIVKNLKISGLLSTIWFLIIIQSQNYSVSPLIRKLIEFRRQLVLGHLSYSDVINQVDIAIEGLKYSDVVEEWVNAILVQFEKLNKLVDEETFLLQRVKKIVAEYITSNTNSLLDEWKNISPRIESIRNEQTTILNKSFPKAVSRLQRRLYLLPNAGNQEFDEKNKILKKIELEKTDYSNKLKIIAIELDNLDQEIEKYLINVENT